MVRGEFLRSIFSGLVLSVTVRALGLFSISFIIALFTDSVRYAWMPKYACQMIFSQPGNDSSVIFESSQVAKQAGITSVAAH